MNRGDVSHLHPLSILDHKEDIMILAYELPILLPFVGDQLQCGAIKLFLLFIILCNYIDIQHKP